MPAPRELTGSEIMLGSHDALKHVDQKVLRAIFLASRLDKIESALEHVNAIFTDIGDRGFYDIDRKLTELKALLEREKEECEEEYRHHLFDLAGWRED